MTRTKFRATGERGTRPRDTVVVLVVQRANTILYTDRWDAMVAFYRDVMELAVEFENDWFVEFALGPGTFVSIASSERATIRPGDGAGLTLSWQVEDVHQLRAELSKRGVALGPVGMRWGAEILDVFDPAGHRLELWSTRPSSVG